ncbi:adenylate/guanylate cyclase domain-containing protein [Marimonas sp. MJW-29]|uniref:Adenylate/guanylate cyclase domain-containing protein n=1 Tax=Sulfitobacter sediminis TaxID=3234186 RepID=A0ABV3RVC7_9RHOB
MERRLAAILAADVVGYSRLMGANEVGTLNALRDIRTDLIEGVVAKEGGRIVKLMGDGILLEFPSVVNALNCALEVQQKMAERNTHIPDDRQIHFRIGVNIGDILIEDGDVFGDGVNIAARLEALAHPGGIAVSGAVRDQVGKRLQIVFEPAGEQRLKNIEGAVSVFHVQTARRPASPVPAEPATVPSIAVLPFSNMSGDPEQEYFADGITEDLITDLSKLSGLFVVSRNSAFVYKNRHSNMIEVARDLGVQNILEGSVRKAGNRVRITAQLIDGVTGGNKWADRYDRDLSDIFALQDEITKTIVDQLHIRLVDKETRHSAPTENADAYNLYLKGRQYFHMRSRKYLEEARQLFLEALQHDPDFARAYVGLAECEARMNDWHGTTYAIEDIIAMSKRAIELAPDLAEAHAALGLAYQISGRDGEAVAAYRMALSLDPLCYDAHHNFARYHRGKQQHERSAYHFIRALEIKPDDYRSPLLLMTDLHALGRVDERDRYLELGLKRVEDAVAHKPDNPDPLELAAATLAGFGRMDEARGLLSRAEASDPEGRSTNGYNAACVYALLGERDTALEWLEKIYPALGRVQREWLRNDPDFSSLHGDPRFQRLVSFPEDRDEDR